MSIAFLLERKKQFLEMGCFRLTKLAQYTEEVEDFANSAQTVHCPICYSIRPLYSTNQYLFPETSVNVGTEKKSLKPLVYLI